MAEVPGASGDVGQDPAAIFAVALANPSVPNIYFNGFSNALAAADIATLLQRNGMPVAVLNMSYSTAKSYAILLGQIVAQYEQATGRDVLTTQENDEALQRGAPPR